MLNYYKTKSGDGLLYVTVYHNMQIVYIVNLKCFVVLEIKQRNIQQSTDLQNS